MLWIWTFSTKFKSCSGWNVKLMTSSWQRAASQSHLVATAEFTSLNVFITSDVLHFFSLLIKSLEHAIMISTHFTKCQSFFNLVLIRVYSFEDCRARPHLTTNVETIILKNACFVLSLADNRHISQGSNFPPCMPTKVRVCQRVAHCPITSITFILFCPNAFLRCGE